MYILISWIDSTITVYEPFLPLTSLQQISILLSLCPSDNTMFFMKKWLKMFVNWVNHVSSKTGFFQLIELFQWSQMVWRLNWLCLIWMTFKIIKSKGQINSFFLYCYYFITHWPQQAKTQAKTQAKIQNKITFFSYHLSPLSMTSLMLILGGVW